MLLFLLAPARATTLVLSQGTYTDAAGRKQTWQINAAHALVWNNQPYLPVGGAFEVRSWKRDATEEDWAADVAALALLQARGVTDLYVQPWAKNARGGFTDIPPARIQRLIDHLEAHDFTYGIAIQDGPRTPLTGHLVRPGAFRQAGVAGGSTVRFALEDLVSSRYVVVSSGGDLIDTGEARLGDDDVHVPVSSRASDAVVFLVPEKMYLPGSALGLPNLWDGFDRYRDALLALFGQVKLGKGFRFFLDALPPDLALREAGRRLVPSGRGWEAEWAAWLNRKYRHVDALHTAWGMPERNLRTVPEAAGLLPLWSGGKGVEAYHNKHKPLGRPLKAVATRSAFWDDLEAFKAESVRGYMNTLADVLKREVADVPVVYRRTATTGTDPLAANLPAKNGFDGIGIEAYGRGSELVTQTAGYAYAQANEAPKTLWLPVTGTAYDKAEDRSRPSKEPGYPSRAALWGELDWLREIGAKGFFVAGLVDMPSQLEWLRDYKQLLAQTPSAAEQQPVVVWYPQSITSLSPKPLSGNRWWLPTNRTARVFDFGNAGRVYALDADPDHAYTLWNPQGPRTWRLRLPKALPKAPAVQVVGPGDVSRKGDVLTLILGPDPIHIRNLPQVPVPLELFDEMHQEAEALVALARKQNRPEAVLFFQQLSLVRDKYNKDAPLTGVVLLQEQLDRMRNALRPYAWLEAEPSGPTQTHSFDETRAWPGASNHAVLAVDTRPSGSTQPVAIYPIGVDTPGTYQLWVAANTAASLQFRMDGQVVSAGREPQGRGASYANGLTWTRVGAVALERGRHTLEMQATGTVVVDTLMLIREDWEPNGAVPPPLLPRPTTPARAQR